MKMWAGRFKEQTDARLDSFNSSIAFDCTMAMDDIEGSIAHATMLGKTGIIDNSEAELICQELKNIANDLQNGTLKLDYSAEDIHMFIEAELTKRIGNAGKRLHTARSRNDQVALDLRLYLRRKSTEILAEIKNLTKCLINIAQEHKNSIMPGYTHLQRAQPITLAHHMLAYCCMLRRDTERILQCRERMLENPLGSAALAGTTYNIDRAMTTNLLDFLRPTINSLDGVSDRDFAIELASNIAILMMHLSRLCEEIIAWCSWEFKFMELSDAFSTGSSIMPQKKNPDIAELVRGKTGRTYGNLITLLTLMKSLPLAYNKDMQEDKEAIFDSVNTALECLTTLTPMLSSANFLTKNMRAAAAKGFINATDCADYLVFKGLPFRDAYKITGELVAYCIANNKTLEELEIEEYKKLCTLFENDIYTKINLENCVSDRNCIGGPSAQSVELQIAELEKFFNSVT